MCRIACWNLELGRESPLVGGVDYPRWDFELNWYLCVASQRAFKNYEQNLSFWIFNYIDSSILDCKFEKKTKINAIVLCFKIEYELYK